MNQYMAYFVMHGKKSSKLGWHQVINFNERALAII
jgi:hypothetical protein